MEKEFVTDQGDVVAVPVVEELVFATEEDNFEFPEDDVTIEDESEIDWSVL